MWTLIIKNNKNLRNIFKTNKQQNILKDQIAVLSNK